MTAVIIACLVLLILNFVGTALKLILSDNKERLRFIKNFKKGQFAIIYLVSMPLFLLGSMHTGVGAGEAVLSAVQSAVELVVLKFGYSGVSALMADNLLYSVTIYICYVMVVINALMLTFALVGQLAVNWVRLRLAFWTAKKVYIITGYSARNAEIIRSIKDGRVVVLADLDASGREEVFLLGSGLYRFSAVDDLFSFVQKKLLRRPGRVINFIVNTGKDPDNLILTEQIDRLFSTDTGENPVALGRINKCGITIGAYVFGEPENESAFVHFVKKSKGRIHYVNKYKLLAFDFIEKYPITRYMTGEHIDYDLGVVRQDVDVNVVMIGFGKSNQQLFLTSVANNQLITANGGKAQALPINYWIYDKEDSKNDKNLNHNYNRYKDELRFNADESDYLPEPDAPAYVDFNQININDSKFFIDVRSRLRAQSGRHAYNYIIIAFGSDMENFDLAEKFYSKIQEWGVCGDTHLFVKLRDERLSKNVLEKEHQDSGHFHAFGNETSVVYNADRIMREKMEAMAKDRHICYTMEYTDKDKAKEAADRTWYEEWNQVQRDSNIYACLSLRMKLNLLGFDYAESGKDAAEEFKRAYEAGDNINYVHENGKIKKVEGKGIVDYGDCNFKEDTVRGRLAWQEHQRWNAYMIAKGHIPATRKEIEKLAGLDKEGRAAYKQELMNVRKHANLTNFDGLKEYRKIMAKGGSEAAADVIKYDYQIMDDAKWLLVERNKYVIIKKNI